MEKGKELLMDECLVVAIVCFIIVFLISVLFNPHLWQGWRNTKFQDKLKKESKDVNLTKPDY